MNRIIPHVAVFAACCIQMLSGGNNAVNVRHTSLSNQEKRPRPAGFTSLFLF